MIIFGRGGDVKRVADGGAQQCTTCERERPFNVMLSYRYAHLYYLFGWITKKEYLLACDICQRGTELKASDVEPTLAKHPIPFIRRYGWSLPIIAFALFMALGFTMKALR